MTRLPNLLDRTLAEALGAFLLVFMGAGAAASVAVTAHNAHRAPVPADLLLVALAQGLALFVIVMVIGKVSGGHVNPAVTIALAAVGRFPWREVAAYLLAQLAGAIAGAACILIVFGRFAATYGRLGAPTLSANTSLVQGLVVEAIGAGILVFTLMAAAVDTRAPAGWAAFSIGLALAGILMLLGPVAGPSVNPARTAGPDLVNLFFAVPVNWPAYVVSYLIGPILGGAAAAWLYVYISRIPSRNAGERTPHAHEKE